MAEQLIKDGVAVVPLFTPAEVIDWNARLLAELKVFPEYVDAEHASKLVDGGFGALANPGSFHNPTVRALRMEINKRTRAFFGVVSAQLHPSDAEQWKIEQLVDRLALRPKGSSTSSESWHRDQSPTKDAVFGGWVNLDSDRLQYFSCNPRTHHESPDGLGFATLPPELGKIADTKKVRIEIPPGHWVVFYQNLVHEVAKMKQTQDSMRLYIGFRLTRSVHPLFVEEKPDKDFGASFDWHSHVFVKQGPPPLASGQYPPLWAKATLNFRKPKLVEWNTPFDSCLHSKTQGYRSILSIYPKRSRYITLSRCFRMLLRRRRRHRHPLLLPVLLHPMKKLLQASLL